MPLYRCGFPGFFCENRPPGSRIIMAGVEKYEASLTIKRTFKKNASCHGDSRFSKPKILVLEPLLCVGFSVCEAFVFIVTSFMFRFEGQRSMVSAGSGGGPGDSLRRGVGGVPPGHYMGATPVEVKSLVFRKSGLF